MEKIKDILYDIKEKWYDLRDEWEAKDPKTRGKIIAIISFIVAAIVIAIIAIISFNKTKISAVTEKQREEQLVDSVSEQVQTVSQIVADNNETMNQSLDEINGYLDSLDAMISDYHTELKEISKTLNNEVTTTETDTEVVSEDFTGIQDQIKEIRTDIADLKSVIEKSNADMTALAKGNNNVKDNAEVLKAITAAQDKITADTSSRFDKINKSVSDLNSQIKTTETNLTNLINALSKNTGDQHKEVIASLTAMKTTIEEGNKTDIAALQKSLSTMQSEYNTYVDKLSKTVSDQLSDLSKTMNSNFENTNKNINDKLSDTNQNMSNGFDNTNKNINDKLSDTNQNIANVDKNIGSKVAGVDSKIDGVSGKSTEIDGKIDTLSSTVTGRFSALDNAIIGVNDNFVSVNGNLTEISSKLDALLGEVDKAEKEGKEYIIKVITDKGGSVNDTDNDGKFSYAEIGSGIIDLYKLGYDAGFAAGAKDVSTTVTCYMRTATGEESTVTMPVADYATWKAGLDQTEYLDSPSGCFNKPVPKTVECSSDTLKKVKVKDNGDGTYNVIYQCEVCDNIETVKSADPDNEPDTITRTHYVDSVTVYESSSEYKQGQIIDVTTTVTPANPTPSNP